MKRLGIGLRATALLALACDGEMPLFERLPAGLGGGGATFDGAGGAGAGEGGEPSESGGTAGASGSGNQAGTTAGGPTSPLLIDDFEDGDSHAAGDLGWWFPVNDRTGTQGWGIEPVTDRGFVTQALRTHGEGFSDWGAIQGANLRGAAALDARPFQVLRLWARVAPLTNDDVKVQLINETGAYTFSLTVTEDWAEYRIPLTEFRRGDIVLERAQLIALQFLFGPNEPFDCWLDDLAFEP